jgi:UDP-N-acetylglucosamine/UDP-N-acetylgalactosamine diphosphorylase
LGAIAKVSRPVPGVAAPPPAKLVEFLERHGQSHLLRWWAELDSPAREELIQEITATPLARLSGWIDRLVHGGESSEPIDPSQVHPVAVHRLPRTDAERTARRHAVDLGEQALAAGEVAVVVVAGGMGSRLGFEGPKGTFPIGPVSGASLFEIHAAKVVALSRRYGKLVPLYVMTSRSNHDTTTRFFADHGNFGLDHVRFFTQGEMPALDRATGRILMTDKGRLALTPDGHGGTLAALAAPAPDGGPGCLQEMRERGVRTIFYFQVDNPLVQVADPAFLGLHRHAAAEMSLKVTEKITPEERVGVVVAVNGQPCVIEYSDLSPELAEQREPDGSLRLWAGSIAIHLFELAFIERLVAGGGQLPFHRAVKKVPFLDERGARLIPDEPNAVKLELFIFDALPLARRYALVETDRAVEFEPLKNETGPESPATVRQRMSDLYAGWLESAGATVARRGDGTVPFGIEISPLYALDAAELKGKLPTGMVVEGPLYLQ